MSFQVDACNEAHELKEKLVAKIEVRFHCYMSSNNGKIKCIKYVSTEAILSVEAENVPHTDLSLPFPS